MIQKLLYTYIYYENKIINQHITSNEFSDLIKKNYTQCWTYFLDFQIEFMTEFKRDFFTDYETFSIWTVIVYNQNLHFNNKIKGDKNYIKFLDSMSDESQRFSKELLGLTGSFGLNAMTISDLTGIPRPTVIRKLKWLVRQESIKKNKYLEYQMWGKGKINKILAENFLLNQNYVAEFLTDIFDLMKNSDFKI